MIFNRGSGAGLRVQLLTRRLLHAFPFLTATVRATGARADELYVPPMWVLDGSAAVYESPGMTSAPRKSAPLQVCLAASKHDAIDALSYAVVGSQAPPDLAVSLEMKVVFSLSPFVQQPLASDPALFLNATQLPTIPSLRSPYKLVSICHCSYSQDEQRATLHQAQVDVLKITLPKYHSVRTGTAL